MLRHGTDTLITNPSGMLTGSLHDGSSRLQGIRVDLAARNGLASTWYGCIDPAASTNNAIQRAVQGGHVEVIRMLLEESDMDTELIALTTLP